MQRKEGFMNTLDNLRKAAKRWLKALRAKDAGARARIERAYPGAPAEPALRDVQHALAREHGYGSWKNMIAARRDAEAATLAPTGGRTHEERVAAFLEFACWDHHTHGKGDHRMHDRAASRLLAQHPEIAHDSIYTAVVCGEIGDVERILAERPEAARERGGWRDWTPILYLSYTRFTHQPTVDNALAIACALLDRGANPNDFYPAGDAGYTVLVGAAGEGEQDSPRQPYAAALFQLLLERGAEPFDTQVLYNTHFSGDVLWWLELVYAHTIDTDRGAAWNDPDWSMFDMGGYGSGARFLLWIALKNHDLRLAEWLLARGANPNAAPPRDPRQSKRTLYEDALREGFTEMADLLARYGATRLVPVLDDKETFIDACFRLDRNVAESQVRLHPEFLTSTDAMFAAARRDRPDVIELLLALGVHVDIADGANTRALHHAAVNNALGAAKVLIERGAEVDPRETNYDATPIGWASHGDRTEMIDFLSRYSRNIWTLAFRGYVDRVRDILQREPDLAKQVTKEGITPLWWLPDDEAKALAIVELLLAHGADPSAKNQAGRTAADWALKRGMRDVAAKLVAAATVEAQPSNRDREHYEDLARDLTRAYDSGDADALERIRQHYKRPITWEDVRSVVWQRVRTVREAKGRAGSFPLAEAKDFVARERGFGSWAAFTSALASGASSVGSAYIVESKENCIRPRRALDDTDWDTIIAVMKERRISSLDAGGQMTDAVLERVSQLEHVTRLGLGGSRAITDEGLRHLLRMPQLEELDLSSYPAGAITDRGLEVLGHLPALKKFQMCWQSGISDAGVANLAACEHLEDVNLLGTPTGDGAIRALAGKPGLRLFKTGRQVSDEALPLLQQFPMFAAWHGGEVRYSLMSPDGAPTHLLLDGPITNEGVASLSGLDGLFGLSFFWHISSLTSDGLARLKDLRNLGFLGCQGRLCDDEAMRHIAAIPRLRMLMAQGTVASDEGFAALSRSQTIEYIWGRECPNLTGRGFTALAAMPRLRGLAVSCKKVDHAALAALPRFPALRELLPMDVQDEGFCHVGQCERLEALWCMYCRDTTDAATEHIASLSHLETYYAGATQITDCSLEILGRLSSLESIELYECKGITDAGLRCLAGLPKLRKIGLSGLPGVTLAGTAVFPARVRVDYSA
jgi:ankyrin repeat protein